MEDIKTLEQKVAKLEKKITELEKKTSKYDEFFADLDEFIKKVVCDHLELSEESVYYSGNYADLHWDTKNLGDACLSRYDERISF